MAKGIALVTGASGGIGLELARLFAKDGYDLVLVARSEGKLRALAAELTAAHGISAHVVPADLVDPAAPESIAKRVFDAGIHVDHLVNNAGFGTSGPFSESDLRAELGQIQVNVAALTALTRLFLPPMVQAGFGRVLNVASTAGFQAGPGMSVYYATKAYVIHFSEGIAHELRGSGVTVTAHCPGATETDFATRAGNHESALFKKLKPAGAEAVALDAYRAMMKGRVLAIHGGFNRFGVMSARFVPRSWLRGVTAKLNATA